MSTSLFYQVVQTNIAFIQLNIIFLKLEYIWKWEKSQNYKYFFVCGVCWKRGGGGEGGSGGLGPSLKLHLPVEFPTTWLGPFMSMG